MRMQISLTVFSQHLITKITEKIHLLPCQNWTSKHKYRLETFAKKLIRSLKCNAVIPRYIALHLSRLRGIFYSAFFTVHPDWLRGFTVV